MRKRLCTLFFGVIFLLAACSASSDSAAVEHANLASAEDLEDSMKQTPMAIEDSGEQIEIYPGEGTLGNAGELTPDAEHSSEEESADTMSYFTFVQESADYLDESGHKLLIEQLTTAAYQSSDAEQSQWVNSLLEQNYSQDADFSQGLLQFAKNNLADLGEQNFYTHSHYVSMGVGRHDASLISLLHLSSAYSGGVHPNSVQTSFNLDLEEKRLLRLEDVIYEGAAEALIRRVKEAVERKFSTIGEGFLYESYVETITTALTYGNMTPYWYFNDEGLVVYFNQYELGPYAAGIISAHISYQDLDSIIKPRYMPAKLSGTVESVTVSDTPVASENYYEINLGAGETIYISVEGEAYHICFSEVYWVEETPVGQSMLFSANHIEDGTVIAITGGVIDPQRIYAIEYCDEAGSHLVYLRNGETYLKLPAE